MGIDDGEVMISPALQELRLLVEASADLLVVSVITPSKALKTLKEGKDFMEAHPEATNYLKGSLERLESQIERVWY